MAFDDLQLNNRVAVVTGGSRGIGRGIAELLAERGASVAIAYREREDAAIELVDLLLHWRDLGIDGVRLRPAVNATDLPVIVNEVVPLVQQAGRFRTAYTDGETLRQRLGLPVAENRYVRQP